MATQICRHIRSNGTRCGCIALSGQTFCYYHTRTGKLHRSINPPSEGAETILHPIEHQDLIRRDPLVAAYYGVKPAGPLVLDLPPLEDRESIQIALSMVVTAMAQDRIDPKRAGLMVYALQIASSNARNLVQPSRGDSVTETVLDEDGRQIAPDVDPESEIILQDFIDSPENQEDEEDEDEDDDSSLDEDDDGYRTTD
jgi:hypothetical protein